MTSMDCQISYIMYAGISDTLDMAIQERYVEGISNLEKAVEYYSRNFVVSSNSLVEKLNILKSLQ